jgi:hypothetical protein
MGFLFYVYRETLGSGRERRAEKLIRRSISRLALRIDPYMVAAGKRPESRAAAFCKRLEATVADHEQGGRRAAQADRRSICELHRRGGQTHSGGTPGIPAGSVADSPDVLRNMARILQPTGAVIPIAYNLNIDGALRNLVGLGLPTGAQSAPGRRSGLRGLPFPLNVEQASLGIAFAAEANVKKLNQWVPEETELQAYLLEVRSMLTALGDRVMVKSELAERHKALCRQIVLNRRLAGELLAPVHQEGKNFGTLASVSGDPGLMQVNRNPWRNLYDLKRLGGDIEYNGN